MFSIFFFLNFNIYFIIRIYINIMNYKTYIGKNLTFTIIVEKHLKLITNIINHNCMKRMYILLVMKSKNNIKTWKIK